MCLFQPTRPRGARLALQRAQALCHDVSTHAPTRGATGVVLFLAVAPTSFQPTRPRGARLDAFSQRMASYTVSTHAPTRGATAMDFASHGQYGVSTHAPTRGATPGCPRATQQERVSTHAPTRGATRTTPSNRQLERLFQPTRPRGARQRQGRRGHRDQAVSTHAPTRGATGAVLVVDGQVVVSTHAPTRGATFTVPKKAPTTTSFNPRAHAGRDFTEKTHDWTRPVFQPTRPRGARPDARVRARAGVRGVSTHAPTRGATAL